MLFMQAYTLLLKKHRAGRIKFDSNHQKKQYRRKNNYAAHCQQKIDSTLTKSFIHYSNYLISNAFIFYANGFFIKIRRKLPLASQNYHIIIL